MLQVPAQAIEAPAHDDIEPPTLGVGEQLVKRGTPILRPAHPAIHVLGSGPPARLDIFQLAQVPLL